MKRLCVMFFAVIVAVVMMAKTQVTHTVNPGETIKKIADSYHITPQKLVEANPTIATDFKVGMVLVIPHALNSTEQISVTQRQDKKEINTVIDTGNSTSAKHSHLSFKGIPIEGSISSFCQNLKAKGFTALGTANNVRIFSGDFTGRRATIGVVATNDGKDVFAVDVLLPKSEEWNNLVNTYNYYKDLYTRKYGKPKFCKEKNPAYDNSNISLMAEVYQGTVTYVSRWQAPGGTIELSIEKTNGVYEGQVKIFYRDNKNMETKLQNDLDDI